MTREERHPAVDIHSHGVPPSLVDLLDAETAGGGARSSQRSGARADEAMQIASRPVPDGMADMARRLAWMDEQGIETQLMSPWLDIIGSGLAPIVGQQWVRRLNDELAQWCTKEGRGRVLPVACIHPGDVNAASDEIERARHELGCVGVILSLSSRYGLLDVETWAPVWRTLENEAVPAILHPPMVGQTTFAGEQQLAYRSLWGRAADTTEMAGRLVLDGLFARFPGLRLVLADGGGYLPFQAHRIDALLAIGRVEAKTTSRPVSREVGKFFFDTVLLASDAVSLLARQYGSQHIVLGSDYPFFARVEDPRAAVEECGIERLAREAMLAGNARGLIGR